MGVKSIMIREYVVECDICGYEEVYHSFDVDRGITVHTIPTAIRAANFHKHKGVLMCPICYENKADNVQRYKQKK